MKIALCVLEAQEDLRLQGETLLNYMDCAARKKADMVLFSEHVFLGIPEHVFLLEEMKGIKMTDPVFVQIRERAKKLSIYVAFSFLEWNGTSSGNVGVLISNQGEVILKQNSFLEDTENSSDHIWGKSIQVAESEFGKFAFLMGNDLFDKKALKAVEEKSPDFILHPFSKKSGGQMNGEVFLHFYENHIREIGVPVFGVGYLDEFYEGGAFQINHEGKLLQYLESGYTGILFCDTDQEMAETCSCGQEGSCMGCESKCHERK